MGKMGSIEFYSHKEINVAAALAACAFLLSGCMTNPIPDGYSGPVAHLTDSFSTNNGDGVNFFYVAKFNGKAINNSLAETKQANEGAGFSMTPVAISRDVPAQAATFTITGRTHYAAPILELTNRVYEVSGNVSFTPERDHSYVVKGVLSDAGSTVWIEDQAGKVMDKKIESKHSALGFFQK